MVAASHLQRLNNTPLSITVAMEKTQAEPSSISTKFLLLLSRSALRKGAGYQPEMAW
jgi:hypothetical protein